MRLEILTGKKFGRLVVGQRSENIGKHTAYKCVCFCGNEVSVRAQSLKRGDTLSCGCLRQEVMRKAQTIHGFYKTPTYNSYRSMIARCKDQSHKQYKDYGGRGIAVCERWLLSFENFLSDMGERPEGKTLDRIDTDKGYQPGNCKWSTIKEQNNNKRKWKTK